MALSLEGEGLDLHTACIIRQGSSDCTCRAIDPSLRSAWTLPPM